jgi:hypothetical protein
MRQASAPRNPTACPDVFSSAVRKNKNANAVAKQIAPTAQNDGL